MKLVDAGKLIKHLEDCAKTYIPCQSEYEVGQADTYTAIADYVSDLEPADGESAHHSRWEYDEEGTGLHCKRCGMGHSDGSGFGFCSYCGAIMDKEKEE